MADEKPRTIINLFGEEVPQQSLLRDKFMEPPFSVLNTRSGDWQNRKRNWKMIGIKSEVGRDDDLALIGKTDLSYMPQMASGTSIFDPALCELMYKWFCPEGGHILDPFAGGSVRGVVAHYLGYKYTGTELRPEQVDSNIDQGESILPGNCPNWICGDSEVELLKLAGNEYDFIFSCPPYADLEVYSDLPEDLSNMSYDAFLVKYKAIIENALSLLKKDHFACFVVGDVRDKDGYYYDFISDTKKAFIERGAKLYNEAILLDPIGTAMIRAPLTFKSKKLVKVHQNVLIFKKV